MNHSHQPRNWLTITFVFSLLILQALGQPAFLKDGLVAYYPFNGNANDESGNRKNPANVQDGFTNNAFGLASSAFSFVKSNERITIPNDPAFNLNSQGEFTIGIWARREGDSAFTFLVNKGGPGGALKWTMCIGDYRDNVPNHPGKPCISFHWQPGVVWVVSDGFDWDTNWHHFVVSCKNGNFSFYMDGKSIGRAFNNSPIPSNIEPLRLGRSGDGEELFKGSIDETRIYNRALSDAEVKALYDYESTPPDNGFITNGLVAYYPFNGNANDESGNRNNGIVNSATLTTNRFDYPENAFNFGNNVDSKITIQSSATIQLADSFSISIWARFNRDWTYHSEDLIGTFFGSKPNWSGWNLSVDTESSTQIGPVFVVFAAGQNGITKAAVAKVDFSDLRNWNHFVATKSNNFIFLYRNGIKIAETQLQSPVSAGRNIILGGSANPVSGANNRDVDDVRIYNRALSDGEVKALYDYESQPLPNNPRTATATAQVVNGFVVGATITSGGNGYTNNPVVTITGGGGTGAKATAFQVNGVVTSITITNPGSGYTSTPTITIAPPPFPPRKATATSQIVNGFVVGTKITDAGFGYDAPPSVLIVGGGGTGATATATVQNGVVTAITITNPGTGYTSAPLVRIASPPFTPKLAIEVSKVNVRLSVVLGRKYQIESSSDLTNWKPAGAVFIAQDEELVQEFDVNTTGNYYRINQVP